MSYTPDKLMAKVAVKRPKHWTAYFSDLADKHTKGFSELAGLSRAGESSVFIDFPLLNDYWRYCFPELTGRQAIRVYFDFKSGQLSLTPLSSQPMRRLHHA
jgi:hypothetical protein